MTSIEMAVLIVIAIIAVAIMGWSATELVKCCMKLIAGVDVEDTEEE